MKRSLNPMTLLTLFLAAMAVLVNVIASAADNGSAVVLVRAQVVPTLAAVRARYATIKRFDTKIALTKNSKYLKRPIASEVLLKVNDGRIEWETTSPIHSLMIISGDTLTLDGVKVDMGGQEKFKSLIAILRSLMTFDWNAIERALDIDIDGQLLRGKPRRESPLSMFTLIEFRLKKDLLPQSLTLITPDESTTLLFLNFHEGSKP
ncbi:MAG: hypothetical protein NTV34_11090 [Proteobacteria bacterium]|nr:hypothetical protein [Pseudomonadota bacterium]